MRRCSTCKEIDIADKLFEACRDNDLPKIKVLLQIIEAIPKDTSGMLRPGLNMYAYDYDYKNPDPKYTHSAVSIAIENNYIGALELMLKAGLNPNNPNRMLHRSSVGQMADVPSVYQAVANGNLEITRLLLEYGADLDIFDELGRSPLRNVHRTCMNDDDKKMIQLLEEYERKQRIRTTEHYTDEKGEFIEEVENE